FGGNSWRDFIRVSGFTPSDDADFSSWFNAVTPDFFTTTGIGVDRGRAFTPADVEGREPVAIVSRAFAKHFFASRDPIGQTITLGEGSDARAMRIVGVSRDAHYEGLRQPPSEIYYAPLDAAGGIDRVVVTVRTTGDPSSIGPALRQVI